MSGTARSNRTENAPSYMPFDPDKHEIRLIKFVTPTRDEIETENALAIACLVGVYSLEDCKSDYADFKGRASGSWMPANKIQTWKMSRQAGSHNPRLVHVGG